MLSVIQGAIVDAAVFPRNARAPDCLSERFDVQQSRHHSFLPRLVEEPRNRKPSRSSVRTGSKANLYATIGPMVEGGVVLSGHTDVVPVEGQAWTSDPWTLTERGGRLYGRGTTDMKGFDALALALVPDMLKAGPETAAPHRLVLR